MEFEIIRLLAQSRPSGTSAVTAYTKVTRRLTTITHILICNTTGSAANASVYYDADGTTYDETTAIVFDTPIPANDQMVIEVPWTMDQTGATVGIKTGTGSALTFSIFGLTRDFV